MADFLEDRGLTWRKTVDASDPELAAEAAGRVCYMSFGSRQYRDSTANYISNLITRGHESVLEHAVYTLLVDGISRALSHQIVRHRIGFAYSQLSQQYHDESEASFVDPASIGIDSALLDRWKDLMVQSKELYREILSTGNTAGSGTTLTPAERLRKARSAARSVLPNATTTTIMITGNARAWRHVLEVRGAIPGDIEMRQYCGELYKVLSKVAPILFQDFELTTDIHGPFVHRIRTKL
jgi:thymidylate synthase (FAD)